MFQMKIIEILIVTEEKILESDSLWNEHANFIETLNMYSILKTMKFYRIFSWTLLSYNTQNPHISSNQNGI
jgi:hypothetical protein